MAEAVTGSAVTPFCVVPDVLHMRFLLQQGRQEMVEEAAAQRRMLHITEQDEQSATEQRLESMEQQRQSVVVGRRKSSIFRPQPANAIK